MLEPGKDLKATTFPHQSNTRGSQGVAGWPSHSPGAFELFCLFLWEFGSLVELCFISESGRER